VNLIILKKKTEIETNNIKIHKEFLMKMDEKTTEKEHGHFDIDVYHVLSTKEEIH